MSNEFVQITAAQRDQLVADAVARGRAEGRAESEATTKQQVTAAREESAAAERVRIQGVLGVPGAKAHEALITGLAFDGKSEARDAALAILNAEKSTRDQVKKEITEEGAKPLAADKAPEKESTDGLSVEERCKKNWAANKDGVRDNFMSVEGYIAFETQMAAGNVRIKK